MKTKNIFWGIFFIAAAALIVANAFGFFTGIGIWSLGFTVILVWCLIKGLTHHESFGIFMPAALLFYIYQDLFILLPHFSLWTVLLVGVLLSIGFSFFLKPKYYFNRHHHNANHYHTKGGYSGASGNTAYSQDTKRDPYETVDHVEEDEIDCRVTFGGSSKFLHSSCLKKGWLSCSFGSLQVYFDNARLHPNGADIQVDCSFGSIELYIPRSFNVRINVSTALGAVEERNQQHCVPDGPVLNLTGNVRFGAVEITYI